MNYGSHSTKGSSQHSFSQVPKIEIQRSTFLRNRNYKTTFDEGYLIPFLVDEVLPGDTFNLTATLLARLATPLKPFMDNLYLDTHFFFVPNRLVWDNWEKFQGAQDNPNDSIDFVVPKVAPPSGGWTYASVGDYFGIPTGINTLPANSLPFRAYNLIWNEWFRDQNIQNSVTVRKTDTGDVPADFALLRRGKRHDYFTSCLPWPQKGPSATIGLSTIDVPVYGTGHSLGLTDGVSGYGLAHDNNVSGLRAFSGDYDVTNGTANSGTALTGNFAIGVTTNGAKSGLMAQTSIMPTPFSINSLRDSVQLQRYLERMARGGTRYTEILRSFWGVTSPDFRLQRPEYLGGGSKPISVSAIPQTSATTEDTPQGNLAAFGVHQSQNGFTHSFVEHGFIIGLLSVRADYTYQQGLNRMWSRSTRYDYATPVLAHLGEQAVLRKEIYATGATSNDDVVFGYQERFGEYRYGQSLITGKFRSTDVQSLDYWHLAQEFSSAPTLSSSFIVENPPVARVVAVQSEPHFLLDSYIECKCTRALPMYGVPGLMDHF